MSAATLSLNVVVPVRNPGKLWPRWLAELEQQRVDVACLVIDSSSDDGTEFTSLPAGFELLTIEARRFNHGGTRNWALQYLAHGTEVVVFMTQDAVLADSIALQTLVSALTDPVVACAYGRQLPHADATPLAAHARLFNYPGDSRVVGLGDKDTLGLKTCFMSNSFAAYRVADLLAVGGFPEDVILGEDMTVAAKLLMAGKRVAYVADARVYHSHNYSIAEDFRRYFDIGVFHARERWLLDNFGGASGEGLRYLRSELKSVGLHQMGAVLAHTVAKFAGYRLGRLERWLPLAMKWRCSMHKNYWNNAQ